MFYLHLHFIFLIFLGYSVNRTRQHHQQPLPTLQNKPCPSLSRSHRQRYCPESHDFVDHVVSTGSQAAAWRCSDICSRCDRVFTSGAPVSRVGQFPGNRTSVTVKNLKANTYYTFYVRFVFVFIMVLGYIDS